MKTAVIGRSRVNILFIIDRRFDVDKDRSLIPLPVRLWAATSHLSLVLVMPIFLLFPSLHAKLIKINGIDLHCLFKPPICGNYFSVILVNLSVLSVTGVLYFISPCLISIALKISKGIHPFLRDNAGESLKFQSKLAIIHIIIDLIVVIIFSAIPQISVAKIAFITLAILMFELYSIPVIAIGIQLLFGIPAAVLALSGLTMSYPKINY